MFSKCFIYMISSFYNSPVSWIYYLCVLQLRTSGLGVSVAVSHPACEWYNGDWNPDTGTHFPPIIFHCFPWSPRGNYLTPQREEGEESWHIIGEGSSAESGGTPKATRLPPDQELMTQGGWGQKGEHARFPVKHSRD